MEPKKNTSSPLRILLVEDDEHDRLTFRLAFERNHASCEITECTWAEDALLQLLADASLFDLVVVDHNLPGMSGLDLGKELLGQKIPLPLVIVTGRGSEQLAVEALKAGVSDYIIKDPGRHYLELLSLVLPEVVRRHGDRLGRKLAEEALRKAHEELEERVKERTAELARTNEELLEYDHIVAHVLKAPLRAIHYYSDFLREDLEGTLNEDQKTYLDSLTHAVRQAAGLVDDVLEFSMVGRRSGPIETIEIGVFLQELISSLDLPSDVEVVMGNEWPSIEAEPALVKEIFLHLIRNAVKFNRSPRKCIEIGWLPAGDEHYELFVRDNGIGIAPRYHEQIFNVFRRLYPEEYEGTGIGLAICKKIVQRHGGRIWVESELGKGSTFYFTISSAG
jgi:signal transduction histidine kinase